MNQSESRRKEFLTLAAWFLAGLAFLAWGLALVTQVRPLSIIHPNWLYLLIGTGVALALSGLFMFAKEERRLAEEAIGPYLAACRWYDLLWLAALVGFCEEWLFRGVLELSLKRFGDVTALVLVNVLFGLLHALSLRYALLAGLIGAFFSLLVKYPGEESLMRPMVAHAVYDFIGFIIIARDARRHAQERATCSNSPVDRD